MESWLTKFAIVNIIRTGKYEQTGLNIQKAIEAIWQPVEVTS